MAVLAVPSLFLLNGAPGDQMIVSALMSLCGLFIGGASNMIGAACAADLGKRAVEYGMPSAVSMVTGFIDGTGSLGAAVGQVTIPYLELHYGWGSVFTMFMVMCAISALALVTVVHSELKHGWCQPPSSSTTNVSPFFINLVTQCRLIELSACRVTHTR